MKFSAGTRARGALLAAALAAGLGGCGGGGGDAPPQPASVVPTVTHEWSFQAHLANGSSVDIAPPGTSGGVDVSQSHDLGTLILGVGNNNAFVDAYATADGKTYGADAVAPRGDPGTPGSRIGAAATLTQSQVLRKTTDAATMDLTISVSSLEMIDSNPHEPTSQECPNPYQDQYFPGYGTRSVYVGCGPLIRSRLSYQISAWKEVPITDASGKVTGYGKVDLAHGTVFTELGGYLKTQGQWRSGDFNWSQSFGPSGDSNLKFKVFPAYDYDECVGLNTPNPDLNCTHAKMSLAKPTVIAIPLDAVNVGEEFKVQATLIADTNNRRQLESFVSARFRDPQGLSGLSYQLQGVEVLSTPATSADMAPPPPDAAPAPSCPTGSDPAAGTLQFALGEVVASEADPSGQATVWITRTGGSQGAVSAFFTTQDGTAHTGTDYRAASAVVRFDDGEQGQRFVTVPVIDNQAVDGARAVGLLLSDVRGCASLGTPVQGTLLVKDDETPPPAQAPHLGGTVGGLVGSGLVLRDVLSGNTVGPTIDGPFTFAATSLAGVAYDVRIDTQPLNPAQACTVTNGSGTMGTADVTNVAVTCTVVAASGSLDTAFGNAGRTDHALPVAKALALQADGRLVTAGGMTVARFLADGTPDTSFGNAGSVVLAANGGPLDALNAIAVQADGRIVVAGQTAVGLAPDDIVLMRLNTDGTLDTSFGTGGKVIVDVAGSTDRALALAVQADGRIVAAGLATLGSGVSADQDIALVRVNADGTLDTGFGSGGKVTTNIAGIADEAHALTLQADGKLVVAGRVASSGGADPDVAVVRYLADGSPDIGFGAAGVMRIDLGGTGAWDEAAAVRVQADGKLLVAGQAQGGGSMRYALLRLNNDGSRDTAFGTNGVVTTAFTAGSDIGRGLALQGDGCIVVAGQVATLSNGDMGIARYLADGSLDTSFGSAGLVRVDFYGGIDNAYALALQADGRIVAAGSARNGSTTRLGLVRVMP